MGTPDFAVESLKSLIDFGFNIVGVVSNVDKPSGRGQKTRRSAVSEFAIANELKLFQPPNLKDEQFIKQLSNLEADLFVVIAFRMLPAVVWKIPKSGTINLHASLLPNYRGAAPINWAIINGEKETGITTFFINEEIDKGSIIFQEKITIEPADNAGTLHDKLMISGAELIRKTVDSIYENSNPNIHQSKLTDGNKTLKAAPKIFKEDCKINWEADIYLIQNFIRGLCPFPAAWTEVIDQNKLIFSLKIFVSEMIVEKHEYMNKTTISDGKKYLKIAVNRGFISIIELQIAGKKRMKIEDFLRGFKKEIKIL
mgnify:CR=1 FL=1|jgi:methionyl-tRNA formyltransferase